MSQALPHIPYDIFISESLTHFLKNQIPKKKYDDYSFIERTPLYDHNWKLIFDEWNASLLTTIIDEYSKKSHFIRNGFAGHRLSYDSGGFQVFTNPKYNHLHSLDVETVATTMLALGLEDNDIAFQLDYPVNPLDSKDNRQFYLQKSASNYLLQKTFHNCVPIIHGWSDSEIKHHINLLQLTSDMIVGAGSWNFLNVSGTQRITSKQTYQRLGVLLRNLRQFKEVFVLGAGNINMAHIIWSNGGNYCDGSSWRWASKYWQIMLPEQTVRGFGSKRNTAKEMTSNDWSIIRELSLEPHYPLAGLTQNEFLNVFQANGSIGFLARASHNAYVLLKEKEIANQFINDPDRYYKYLVKRFTSQYSNYWKKRLHYVHESNYGNYVQDSLDIFLKTNL